jgi:hypothetical protein
MPPQNETVDVTQPALRLGRLPAKTKRSALRFDSFFSYLTIPKESTIWKFRKPLPLRSYGNGPGGAALGCCTIAKQVVAAQRLEALETGGRRTIHVTVEEIARVYLAMTAELYGGGDTGAYETDALDNWRNPDKTFRATDGRIYPIAAYLKIDHTNPDEMKAAIALSGAKGIAICANLPRAYDRAGRTPPATWDLPKGQPLVGEWMAGSWGGHSLWNPMYTALGLIPDHTWDNTPQNLFLWDAVLAYVDEAHMVIDSMNSWRTLTKGSSVGRFDLGGVRDAVNAISSIQIP